MTPTELNALAEKVEALDGPTREIADEVLLACGWRLNHDADEIAAWRVDPGVCEGEDGNDYPVTLADRMNWACWYPPGKRPFRDSWIDGHYRPNPLASLDAAMTLVPDDWNVSLRGCNDSWHVAMNATNFGPLRQAFGFARSASLALTAASLRARAASLLAEQGA